jgi:thioredoxin reductase
MKVITNAIPIEIKGDNFVSALIYKNTETNEIVELPTEGVFVEIGHLPATDFVKGLVKLDEAGHIITDPRTQKTSELGIWSAGDCTDGLYAQNNIAAGDAVKAVEDIYKYLKN